MPRLNRTLALLAAAVLATASAARAQTPAAAAAGTPFTAEGVQITLAPGFPSLDALPASEGEWRFAGMRADSTIVLLSVYRSPLLRAAGGWQLVAEGMMQGLQGGEMEVVDQSPVQVESGQGYVFRLSQKDSDRPVRMYGRFLGFRGRPLAASVTVIGQPADPSAEPAIQAMVESLRLEGSE